MSITGWTLDKEGPRDAAIITFAYPEMTSFFHTRTLRLGRRLHQYRLDRIEMSSRAEKLILFDLDTGKMVVLTHKL